MTPVLRQKCASQSVHLRRWIDQLRCMQQHTPTAVKIHLCTLLGTVTCTASPATVHLVGCGCRAQHREPAVKAGSTARWRRQRHWYAPQLHRLLTSFRKASSHTAGKLLDADICMHEVLLPACCM